MPGKLTSAPLMTLLAGLCLGGITPRLPAKLPLARPIRAGATVAKGWRRPTPSMMADKEVIISIADAHGINHRAALAIAWTESGNNLDTSLRGHHCWYSVPGHWVLDSLSQEDDSIYVPRYVHHERDCEVGRYQIKPSTARRRCANLNVFTYEGNILCFFRMFYEDQHSGGTEFAIRHHNGSGPMTYYYRDRVFKTMGWLDVEGI